MEPDELKLEPVKFLPDTLTTPWGKIDYCLADLGFVDSLAADGMLGGNTIEDLMQIYLERISGENVFEAYGTQFPVMVKRLYVKGRSSLHVNPNDEDAAQRYDSLGKTALWYVLEADKDSRLYLGFRRDVEPAEFYEKCQDGTVDSLLKEVKPHAGQAFLIPPGIVHAAKGVTLLEISEASEMWFRLYDWDASDRSIHLEEGFDLIDFHATDSLETNFPVTSPQLNVRRISLTDAAGVESPNGDSFRLYTCLKGSLQAGNSKISEGGVILVPADVLSWQLVPGEDGAELLEVSMDVKPQEDEQWTAAE